MKRSQAKGERKARSPYHIYGKTPYRYSDIYSRWRAAISAGRTDEAANLSRQHRSRFMSDDYALAA